VQDGASKRAQGKIDALQRVVLPISALASWLLVAAGALMTLHVLGINIAPLLTVGGVSGIIVGLSAQSVMSNMISGVNLVRSPTHWLDCLLQCSRGAMDPRKTRTSHHPDTLLTMPPHQGLGQRSHACMPLLITSPRRNPEIQRKPTLPSVSTYAPSLD
jgi:hypothetical protein